MPTSDEERRKKKKKERSSAVMELFCIGNVGRSARGK